MSKAYREFQAQGMEKEIMDWANDPLSSANDDPATQRRYFAKVLELRERCEALAVTLGGVDTIQRCASHLKASKVFLMAKKNTKLDKSLSKAADAILDILAEMPAEKARAIRAGIKALALKSYRSANRGRVSRRTQKTGAS